MPVDRSKQIYKLIAGAGFFVLAAVVFLACKFDSFKEPARDIESDFNLLKALTSHAETFRPAVAENIHGDFENKNSFEYLGIRAEMTRENGDFFISLRQNEELKKYKIAGVVGSRRLEEYIAEIDGIFERLPVGYDLRQKRWINLNAAYFEADGESFFRHQKDWKSECASCHLAPGSGAKSNQILSALSAGLRKTATAADSDSILTACGQCHAKGLPDDRFKSGPLVSEEKPNRETLSAHPQSKPKEPSHSFADGPVRLAAHEYQGVLRSVCYLKSKAGDGGLAGEKINCLSCHSANNQSFDVKTDEKLHDNQTCTQCHGQFATPESLTEHTRHPGVPEANSCVHCHMPEIVYGNLSFQKTHEIAIPDPALTVTAQIPNACNGCHIDKPVNWSIRQSRRLWPQHFRDAEISPDAQFDQPEGIRGLFAGDALTRAWSADNLAKHADPFWAAPFLLSALETEKYPLVRYFLTGSMPIAGDDPASPGFLMPGYLPPNIADLNVQNANRQLIERLRRKRPSPDIKIGE